MATSRDSPAGARDVEEFLRSGKSTDEPMDAKDPREPCENAATPLEGLPAEAQMPVEAPIRGGTGTGRRRSGDSHISGISTVSGTQAPAPLSPELL